MDDLTREFLIESQEGLDRMERCLTDLEERPQDAGLIGEIFRSVHTIKGTTGFLGFKRLEKLAHAGENLLSLLREVTYAPGLSVVNGSKTTMAFGTTMRELLLGFGYDWKIFGDKELSPHLELTLGFGMMDFGIDWGTDTTIQHTLPHGLVLDTEYIGTKGTHLGIVENPNRSISSIANGGLQIKNATSFNYQTQGANSHYQAAQLRVTSAASISPSS